MKLTKDEEEKLPFGVVNVGEDYYELPTSLKTITLKRILKNQDLAEKWLKITENPNWVKGTREFSELYEIVERLKKELEDVKALPKSELRDDMIDGFQKILGEETCVNEAQV